MKSQVTFRSDLFPAYEGEEEEVNPGLWGRRLAEYLKARLESEGIETGEFFAEDWGWVLPIKNDGFSLWIGCGHQDGEDDEFLCFIEPSRPEVRKLFRRVDTTEQVGRIADALDRILGSDAEIRELRWLTPEAP